MVFTEIDPYQKLTRLAADVNGALNNQPTEIPLLPSRNGVVLPPERHTSKKGLSLPEGRARLLHDLASIEMQAMELGLRTLYEYPEAPKEFREQLAEITLSEGRHLKLCLDALEKLGFSYGHWPVHLALWQTVSKEDSLLDRILIVHRYLEGSGLDAGDTLLRRLHGVLPCVLHPVVKTIVEEEVGHVEFGSRWYRNICKLESIDPNEDFFTRFDGLKARIPRRIEKISWELRKRQIFRMRKFISRRIACDGVQNFIPEPVMSTTYPAELIQSLCNSHLLEESMGCVRKFF